MATKPSSGDTDWGTALNAHLAVGHDSDGTHKKSQMLTDMEWSPTSYAGGGELTLPNGVEVKWGYKACDGTTPDTLTFTSEGMSAFSNAAECVYITMKTNAVRTYSPYIAALSTTAFTIGYENGTVGYYWIAIGY